MVASQATPAAWDAIAEGYDNIITPFNMELGAEALRRIEFQEGMRLLDVASGCGAIALPAARRGGDVLAIDISPHMVERLKTRARDERLSNLGARVMDGQNLELDDDSFDVAASQFGVMLFPDLPRGLEEMARVTRPGGQVLVVTFGPPQELDFIKLFIAAIQSVNPEFEGMPTDPPPLPFQVSDPEILRQRMEGAGLCNVRIERTIQRVEPPDGYVLWEGVKSSNPIGATLASALSEEQQQKAANIMDTLLNERRSGGQPAIRNAVNIAVGTA